MSSLFEEADIDAAALRRQPRFVEEDLRPNATRLLRVR